MRGRDIGPAQSDAAALQRESGDKDASRTVADSFLSGGELADLGLRTYGKDVLVSRTCSFFGKERITLGSHVRIDDHCVVSSGLRGYVTVGDYVHVAAYVALYGSGGIQVGDFCGLSPKVTVFSESDDFSGEHLVGPVVPSHLRGCHCAKVEMSDHTIIGASSVVLPGVTVGEGVAVGALSLVRCDLPSWGIYVGCPAQRIGDRSRKLLALAASVRAAEARGQETDHD